MPISPTGRPPRPYGGAHAKRGAGGRDPGRPGGWAGRGLRPVRAGLYGYCRSILGGPADAGDAVQDTFIIAAGALGGLREPGQLRSWLYAVARNESHRRLRARALPVPAAAAGESADDTVDLGTDAEAAELRAIGARRSPGWTPATGRSSS